MILLNAILMLFVVLSSIAIVVLGIGKIINVFIEKKFSGFLCSWIIVVWLSISIPVCAYVSAYLLKLISPF
ncbi:hypothetical protein AVV44_gp144 [Cronobacter phage S13]|jgi:hypothetical protein|uniref:Uncharacterized protein n=1 Tax=Cronobacter phage LPCS28 TaxID=2924885 RepID=A0AAE9G556_9CAUD|nr:hypothetical protein AVV44_gp144 [Cronobacter phage S13]YP_010665728.1 hypothetical protein PQB73_gp010 [Cronobacter phage LPCS28]AIA64943.1 hypothetical protein S13_144 [Cronobacter phage S13]UNY46917.1 hypothetical protein EHEKIMEA_00010 [Cronobacter phage LPCS28]